MNHVRYYIVGMKVVKMECDEPFTDEEAKSEIRREYPNDVITPIHPSKACLFADHEGTKPPSNPYQQT